MKVRLTAVLLLAGLTAVLTAQDQSSTSTRRDDSYKATCKQLPVTQLDRPNGEDPDARAEWMRERFAGNLDTDFARLVIAETEKERAAQGSAVNGTIAPAAPGQWFSIGPVRSNWIQNGVRVTASDTGRLRTILPHPSNLDVVYILTSSGGLWKTTNFRQPRPRWTAISESLPSMAGGSIAFGASPETIYHGIGDPFDIGVGGAIFKSENGGQTWGAPAILSGASFVADLKVDTSVSPEVVLAGTNNGLFRSANAGATYTRIAGPISTTPGPPAVANIVWSLAKGEAGWVANVVTAAPATAGCCCPPIVARTGRRSRARRCRASPGPRSASACRGTRSCMRSRQARRRLRIRIDEAANGRVRTEGSLQVRRRRPRWTTTATASRTSTPTARRFACTRVPCGPGAIRSGSDSSTWTTSRSRSTARAS
jgi:hypothetical protein